MRRGTRCHRSLARRRSSSARRRPRLVSLVDVSESDGSSTAGRVIFSASARGIAALDIRIGPCSTQRDGGRVRAAPLASPWSQQPDPIESVVALFEVLRPDQRGSPWQATRFESPGELYSLSPEFVEGLAHLRDLSSAADSEHPTTAPYREVASRWLRAFLWEQDEDLDALVGRLLRDADEAHASRTRHIGLYCWFGPLVLDELLEDGRMTMRDVLRIRRGHRRT